MTTVLISFSNKFGKVLAAEYLTVYNNRMNSASTTARTTTTGNKMSISYNSNSAETGE